MSDLMYEPTEDKSLEKWQKWANEARMESIRADKAERERDKLLSALKVVTRSQRELAIFADGYGQLDEEHVQAWTQAQAAIDTMEGE